MLAGLVLKRPWWEGRMGILVPFGEAPMVIRSWRFEKVAVVGWSLYSEANVV